MPLDHAFGFKQKTVIIHKKRGKERVQPGMLRITVVSVQ